MRRTEVAGFLRRRTSTPCAGRSGRSGSSRRLGHAVDLIVKSCQLYRTTLLTLSLANPSTRGRELRRWSPGGRAVTGGGGEGHSRGGTGAALEIVTATGQTAYHAQARRALNRDPMILYRHARTGPAARWRRRDRDRPA